MGLSGTEQLRLVAWVLAVAAVIAAFVDVTKPGCGVHHENGALVFLAVGTVGFATGISTCKPGRRMAVAVVAAAAAFLAVGAAFFLIAGLTWVHNCAN